MNFKISYAITAFNDSLNLEELLKTILSSKRKEDEIVVQVRKGGSNKKVSEILKKYKLKKNLFKFTNTTDFKNNLRKLCKGDYIFQLDADEIPADETVLNLHKIIESNIDIDVFVLPRINIISNATNEDFEKFNLSVHQHGFIDWPDYQYRIFKNSFNIKWDGTLGYSINGVKTGVQLPDTAEYAITKISTQQKAREQYSKNLTLCLCVANSEDCLDRFFNWAIPRFENILIVESESEDSTGKILKKYKKQYPDQIDLHFNKIKNIAHQKQHCLDLANTEWKLIVDADEILENYNWNDQIKKCELEKIDLGFLPRYNLQKDEKHYLKTAYPDLQPRLINSKTSFSTKPQHETHHVMVGYRNQANIQDCHIIHWGHIRSEDQNLWKSNMRKKFATNDACDGEGLLSHNNWFHERNKILKLDQKIEKLPNSILQYTS